MIDGLFLLPLMALMLIVGLCVVAWRLAVFALPFMIALEIAQLAYGSGTGVIGSGLLGIVSGAAVYGTLVILLIVPASVVFRLFVALVFAAPAAVAGYALVHGIARETVESEVWRVVLCLIGGGLTGIAAFIRIITDAAGLNSQSGASAAGRRGLES